MKPTTGRRCLAVIALLAVSTSLAGCGNGAGESASDADTSGNPADAGGTEAAAPFGAGCAAVPTGVDNPGSLLGMSKDTVGTATANNPILSTLTAAIASVSGLIDVLDDPTGSYTVFAPYNPGFALIPHDELRNLLAGADAEGLDSPLATMLQHHVLTGQDDASAVVGEHETLAGDTLIVSRDKGAMTVSDGSVTATVLCGNIATANATVYIIDRVLTGVSDG